MSYSSSLLRSAEYRFWYISTGVPDRGLCIPMRLSLLAAREGGALFCPLLSS